MFFRKKKSLIVSLLISLMMITAIVFADEYIPSNRDTKKPPETMDFEIKEPSDFTLLYETKDFKYYYKEERNIIAIYDRRSGYTWKTGLDIPYNKDILDQIDEAIKEGKVPEYIPQEERLNTTYTGIANSLITIEYYDNSDNIKRSSSGAHEGVDSTMNKLANDHYRLDIRFKKLDIKLKLHIQFDEKGICYEIKDEEIEGTGTKVLAAVTITPFLGASGGQQLHWNEKDKDYNISIPKDTIPGYVFIPDGPGALVRFQDNLTTLKEYVGDVYGADYSQSEYYYRNDRSYLPFKNPTIPVFGISHGEEQNAFFAYAIDGAEHMEILVMPEENMTYYTWAYPRFVYNRLFYQVYNKKGDGYFTLLEERNHFDIKIRYDFLEGNGDGDSHPANYVGMALTYRDYLLENDLLRSEKVENDDLPIRLDFIMSDTKKSVLGYEDIVVTTMENVEDILTEIHGEGITNINSGLYGWQKGGITLGKPWKTNWNKEIGKFGTIKNTVATLQELGIDVSLAQDYVSINDEQVNFNGNAAKHANGWYNQFNLPTYPIKKFSYAKPAKSVEWLRKQMKSFEKIGMQSVSIEGMSNRLLSDYNKQRITVQDTIELFENSFAEIQKEYKINAMAPNAYLWKYVDRFLQAPVFSTQFIIETDNVPFLQLVLAGNMEMYAPYSNFSFYTDKDVLRMIDYNVYPSFVITEKSAHYLSSTNSADYYSTEFTLYKELIKKTYGKVSDALGSVIGIQWMNRKVVQNGVIVNQYENGVEILINYTDSQVQYKNQTIDPVSYQVFH